ncbi:MAG: HAD family hydrolase [Alphaproteobacteria bacterium]|nr:MAG: HAD family hydrolase [Alphaproteobacteria bacterium]
MEHPFRLIIFDYDGTLVDSQGAIVAAMAAGFAVVDLAPPPASAVRRVVGLALDEAIARLLPSEIHADSRLEVCRRIAAAYRSAFLELRTRPDYHEPLFPGVRETLAALDSPAVCLGIATGKARRGLLASLEHHGLGHHFVTLQTADIGPGKPHPGMVRRAMAEIGVLPSETVVVGDTTYDMEMAANARVPALGVAWGYHDPADLRASGARAVIETFAALPSALAALGTTAGR